MLSPLKSIYSSQNEEDPSLYYDDDEAAIHKENMSTKSRSYLLNERYSMSISIPWKSGLDPYCLSPYTSDSKCLKKNEIVPANLNPTYVNYNGPKVIQK